MSGAVPLSGSLRRNGHINRLLTLLLRGQNIIGRLKFFSPIPRVFQRDWGRVSKHVVKRETFAARLIPDYGGSDQYPVC
jgi:hypothetical protein